MASRSHFAAASASVREDSSGDSSPPCRGACKFIAVIVYNRQSTINRKVGPSVKNAIDLGDGTAAFPGYPSAVSAAGLLFFSGVRPLQAGTSPLTFDDLPPEARIGRQGFRLAEEQEEEVAVDAWSAHDVMDRVLAAAGSRPEHMLRTRIWQHDKRFYPAYERVRMVRQPKPSASSGHSVTGLVGRGGRAVGLDGIAIAVNDAGAASNRIAVGTATGTAEAGNSLTFFSVAARHGAYGFLAGHIPVKQEPGYPSVQSFEDVPPEGRGFATNRSHADSRDGPIAAQTWFTYNRMRESLEKIGAKMTDVVHCLVGLEDLRDLPMFHRVHRDTFGDAGPALTILGAGEVGHRGARVVIEPTVYICENGGGRCEWPGMAPFSAPMARRAGALLFLSGMLGIDADARHVCDLDRAPAAAGPCLRAIAPWASRPDLPAQCWQAWSNLKAALESCGSSLVDLVKLTVFLANPADWPVFEAVRTEFIATDMPAIECVAVPNPGPSFRSAIQIDAVALTR
jgi:enamine deaminase RidA (YjgF/YER057c/UK114 family)